VLSPIGLGLLARLVPPDLVDEVLEFTDRGERRWRAWPARLGVYFVLALCLLPTKSYSSVVRAMLGTATLARLWTLGWEPPSTTALSKARDRIGALPLEMLFRRLARLRPSLIAPWSHAFGLLVCAWDGTEIALADTAGVAGRFPRHRARKGNDECGVPKARLLVLLACGTRQLIDTAVGGLGKGEGEVSLAHRLTGSLRAGMLLLADRAFLGYPLWTAARASGADLLWRAKNDSPRLRAHRVLPDGSYLARLHDPADVRAWRRNVRRNRKRGHRPPTPRRIAGVTVRVVEARITVVVDGSTRTEQYRLVTSLLDPRLAPAGELVALYARRWVAETGIGEIKTILLARRPLRPRTDLRARQELWAALIVYQSLRVLACHAAHGTGMDPSRISFTATRDAVQLALTTTPAETDAHLEWVCHDLRRRLITRHIHARTFPRALKNTFADYPHRSKTRQLTCNKASYRVNVLPTPTPPETSKPSPTPAQPRAA
jgi:hypothetical protein